MIDARFLAAAGAGASIAEPIVATHCAFLAAVVADAARGKADAVTRITREADLADRDLRILLHRRATVQT